MVTDGVDGWTYPAGDSTALATVLRSLDREQVEAGGRGARATYEARFTNRAFASRWLVAVLGPRRQETAEPSCPGCGAPDGAI